MHDDTLEWQSLPKHYSPKPPASPPRRHSPLPAIGHRLKEIINSCFFFCPFSGEIMSNIFFIDLFINVENELLKGLCWSNPDAIKVIDAASWVAPMAGGKIPGAGWGVNYIDWPPFPHQKPRWWPKALSRIWNRIGAASPTGCSLLVPSSRIRWEMTHTHSVGGSARQGSPPPPASSPSGGATGSATFLPWMHYPAV